VDAADCACDEERLVDQRLYPICVRGQAQGCTNLSSSSGSIAAQVAEFFPETRGYNVRGRTPSRYCFVSLT